MSLSAPPCPIVRLVIVDDSELVRVGLRTLLKPESGIAVIGEAANVAQAISVFAQTQPDVVLMDIRLPDGLGFDACRRGLEQSPSTRVIFLTSVVDDKLVTEAIRSGGHGYLLKEINGQGLIQAIQDVASGKSILDQGVTARVMNMVKSSGPSLKVLDKLSPQERRVMALVAEGKSNKEVGTALNLSDKTVKNYLSNIFNKLNVSRRGKAVVAFLNDERC